MKQYVVPAIFLTGTILFAILYIVGPSNSEETGVATQEGTVRYNRVQNLRERTSISRDLKRQKAILDKKMNKPGLDPGRHKANRFHTTSLNQDQGPAARDLDTSGSVGSLTLDQRMDEFLAKREAFEEIESVKRQQYVKLFISEARKMGFEVEVDQNFEIVSVKKIPANNQ